MPLIKPINGHTGCGAVMRYLTKKNRALACDYLNLEAPVKRYDGGMPSYGAFDWASEMDRTRERHGNDAPWRGKRARTYIHYIISPDPRDEIDLTALRELATAWAKKHFGDFEVAIVYHDDNEHRIPHAHVVVNNTSLCTGRRIQVPDPLELNRSLQRMAADRGMSAFDNVDRHTARPEGERGPGRDEKRKPPRTKQRAHSSRTEKESAKTGRYSWVADIRARVEVARVAAASEEEFKQVLAGLGVTVSDNSPRARRRDWVFALAEQPTRRVSGERLGLLYSRESLQRRFAYRGACLGEADRATIAEIAKNAIELKDLGELQALAGAVSLVDDKRIKSVEELDRLVARGELDPSDPAVRMARGSGFLPERARPRDYARAASRPDRASARRSRGGMRDGRQRQQSQAYQQQTTKSRQRGEER